MFPLLVLFLCASSYAYQVPPGIEKITNYIIRNGTTYYAVYLHGDGLLMLANSTGLSFPTTNPVTILSKANGPRWVTGSEFQSADINVIDEGQIRIYFSASSGTHFALGVAFSDFNLNSHREYLTLNSPLYDSASENFIDPRLVITSSQLLLLYTHLLVSGEHIDVVALSSDGLAPEGAAVRVLQPDLHWEGNQLKNLGGFERNGYIYILYQTEGAMGVARSRSNAPLGLFEKMADPLIPADKAAPAAHVLQNSLQWNDNVLFLCASSYAYQVPAGIEKLANNLIRNGTNYYALYVHGRDLLALDWSTEPTTSWPNPRVPILSKPNGPRWSTGEFQSADINVIDDGEVRIYFSASNGQRMALGVAFSDAILDETREYLTLNSSLLEARQIDSVDPRLVVTNDQLLLFYTMKSVLSAWIASVSLSSDGLTTISAPVTVLQPDLHWEGNMMKNLGGFERNGYIYILYETEGGMGIARRRSDAPLGMFEKMADPLIPANKAAPARHVLFNSLQWNTNGWPSIDF